MNSTNSWFAIFEKNTSILHPRLCGGTCGGHRGRCSAGGGGGRHIDTAAQAIGFSIFGALRDLEVFKASANRRELFNPLTEVGTTWVIFRPLDHSVFFLSFQLGRGAG